MSTVLDELFFVVRRNPDPSGTAAIFGIYENINRANENILEFDKDPATSGLYAVSTLASGVSSEQIINIINEPDVINSIASGVFEQAFFTLPLKGDDDNVTHQTVNNLAVARYIKNTNTNTIWNTIAPLGGASGVEFQFSWFPETAQTSDIRWRLNLTQLPSGVDTSAASGVLEDLNLSDTWIANRLYIHTMDINATVGSLENFSLKFERRGQDVFDNYSKNLYVVSYAVRFKT